MAITGRKISCPAAAAAVRMPITRPRRATNQRLAIVAAKTMAIEPVPSPISRPQVSISCQPWVTKMVNPLPAATRSRATLVTWRMPKRSISAAANGAISPYRIRLTLTALDIRVRDQPNSSSSGTISTPGAARKPAAPTRATNATAATHQAGWIPVRGARRGRGGFGHAASMPRGRIRAGDSGQDSGRIPPTISAHVEANSRAGDLPRDLPAPVAERWISRVSAARRSAG